MAVTKRPILNVVVMLLLLATIVSLCIPCWTFTVVDMENLYLQADGTITTNVANGYAMLDENKATYSTIKSVNGVNVKVDGTTLIYSNKTPVGDLVANNTVFDLKGSVLTAEGKQMTVNADGVLCYVGGDVFTTTVKAPVSTESITSRKAPVTQVSDSMYVNIKGQIVTSAKKAIQIPVVREESTSVMGYIAMPHHRVNKLVTAMFEGIHEGFILNGQVWLPILLFILCIVSIVFMLKQRNVTNSLIMPIIVSACGIIVVWTNQLTLGGGLMTTLLPSVLMLGTILVAVYNGNWMDSEGDWRKDPSAAGKIKEIKKCNNKKDLPLLKSYTQSSDPAIRISALQTIAKIGTNDAFHPIIAQLSSSNADVRMAAAEALATLGDSRGRTYLMYFMEHDPSPEVREAMSVALSKLPSVGA